jgi:DNA repair exonuclease SbcCD ATPase subunit
MLPKLREAQQLCKLRALRVQRARDGVTQAQAEVERAAAAVTARQHKIEQARRAVEDLQKAVVTTLVPSLPRWSGVARAQQERLSEQLEREEYELIQDERALEQAQEKLQQARAELTRALAREDVVRDLAKQSKRALSQDRERRAERDLEDQGRPAHPQAQGIRR